MKLFMKTSILKSTRLISTVLLLTLQINSLIAQEDTTKSVMDVENEKTPFAFGDFTWLNGNNRQAGNLLSGKYITYSIILDAYYNYSFNAPKDNTINTTSIIGRHNEITMNLASFGVDVNYKNVIARLYLQTGSMLSVIQETDPTVNRGRNLRSTDLKFIREAVIGYKWNKMYGIIFEAGIFMSYIGLESYVSQENWSYQRSFVCDFTPFYFTGARMQIYPRRDLKIEPWVMNGWYSYGKFNQGFGTGMAIYYRPKEWLATVANFYYGTDTRNNPGRTRFHHDNTVMLRYYNNKDSKGISKAAFSLNSHYGFEDGGIDPVTGTNSPSRNDTYFAGTSFANRIWFANNKIGLTTRAGYLTNPGRYLPVSPSPVGFTDGGTTFEAWEYTGTIDYMPNDYFTFRLEFLNRNSSVPYFAGPNGTTSPDGWQGTPGTFTPDLVPSENRFIVAMNVRF